jgi:hypothetical protein
LKRILILSLSFVFLLQYSFVVYAKTENATGKNSGSTKSNSSVSPKPTKPLLKPEPKKIKSAPQELTEVAEVIDDPDIKDEIEDLAHDQSVSEEAAEESLEKIDGRPAAVKFLIGPDYKNLGQLRSEIVKMRNNVSKLERILEKADTDEQPEIEEAISQLQSKSDSLQLEMSTKLSNFSLFGWLFKWLNGFTPPTDEEGVPTVTITPVTTGPITPTVTVEATSTPIPSPTEAPTPTI